MLLRAKPLDLALLIFRKGFTGLRAVVAPGEEFNDRRMDLMWVVECHFNEDVLLFLSLTGNELFGRRKTLRCVSQGRKIKTFGCSSSSPGHSKLIECG